MALCVRPRLKRPDAVERDAGLLLAELGTLKLDDVRRRDIVAVLDDVRRRGALHQAEMIRSRVGTFFAWALERELIDANPCDGLARQYKPQPRERALDDAELRTLWGWLDAGALSESVRDGLRLVLLTGQRPGEVFGLPWSELDLPARLWHLPAERSKNGRAHGIPLGPLALGILDARRTVALGDFVFPGNPSQRRPEAGPMNLQGIANALRRALEAGRPAGLEPFTPHDLRRSCRTGALPGWAWPMKSASAC